MVFKDRDYVIEITQKWQGDRFADGRPRVPDSLLERIRGIKLEEAWKFLLDQGYQFQYEGDLRTSQPGKKLVGRAATVVMVPSRPDLLEATMLSLKREGKRGMFQWTLDELEENDVVVSDCYDKVHDCTFLGGNLTTNIHARTKNGGAVIWGGIRDLEQIQEIDTQIYYRQTDPGWMRDGLIAAANRPCRIGRATCLPGDVVLGTVSGVLFIPAHLAEAAAIDAEKKKICDVFGFEMLRTGTYTAGQIDASWSLPIWEHFLAWFASDPRAEKFQHLCWDEELTKARTVPADPLETSAG